jgi:rhamnosyltransferase
MIAAVITTYKPDASLRERFAPLLAAGVQPIVVDNTPAGHDVFELPQSYYVIRNGRNMGLGAALNVGLAEAHRRGADRAILFDQDSTPTEELVYELTRALDLACSRCGPRTILGPTHLDDQTGHSLDGIRGGLAAAPRQIEVTCLPTSGMIVPLAPLDVSDAFSEDLFLDLADFEWCWRLRANGWRVLRDRSIYMKHRLGLSERSLLGFRFHVPAPYRHYFQFRDTLRLLPLRYVPAYSKLRLVGILPFKLIAYPLLLDHGAERLGWMLRGVRDAFLRVRGVGAAATRLCR